MKIEDQVVSLELSQKLSELGVKVEGLFNHSIPHPYLVGWKVEVALSRLFKENYTYIPAYTVAELGSMLPSNMIGAGGSTFHLEIVNHYDEWIVWYENEFGDDFKRTSTTGHTEANSRALMLIWLIENGHLSVEEVNK